MLVCILPLCAGLRAQPNSTVQDAMAALQRGDLAGAERTLRAAVGTHPDDAWMLSLLGYTLDNEKRTQEADEFHRRALKIAPHGAEILNNYGTHLWTLGEYARAESVLSDALAASPTYFNALYNLGMMATYNGHYDRARAALEAALQQQPKNVDVLYRLADAEELSKHFDQALSRLALAAQLAPKRADVQKLLAVTAAEMGALPDAAAAWDRYLALEPNDDAARRERGYTSARIGKLEAGIADLEWYLARHAGDKVAHYELGQAERTLDAAKAIQQFDRALELDPDYLPARTARGSLHYQNGNFDAALKDLEAASAQRADDPITLDHLGQTYQALDRTADAVRVLRRAAELAPDDSKILLHFGRTLADAGQAEESRAVLQRFRELGPEKKTGVPEGLVAYLSLTPAERRRDYRARLEKTVSEHPGDVAAQLAYLKFLLEERDTKSASGVAAKIAALKPPPGIFAEAGHALLGANQFGPAKDLLQQAIAGGGAGSAVQLDAAIATFRAGSATAGLALLDRIPAADRRAAYELARGQMLDALGKLEDAVAALDRAINATPSDPEVCLQAASYLASKGAAGAALGRIQLASRRLPDNREILLMKAIQLEFASRAGQVSSIFGEVQRRWPEWSALWAAEGITLASHGQYAEAVRPLETAVAMGARAPEISYFLAKTYDAVGRAKDAQTAREQIPAADRGAGEKYYLQRFFEGSLLGLDRAR